MNVELSRHVKNFTLEFASIVASSILAKVFTDVCKWRVYNKYEDRSVMTYTHMMLALASVPAADI